MNGNPSTNGSQHNEGSQVVLPRFSAAFLERHVGILLSEPKYAIIELVANSWDAGSDEVKITWPKHQSDLLVVQDNGIGMTKDEFLVRWTELNYDRLRNQGEDVVFPPMAKQRPRTAFGRNGVGRHAMFCFSDEYWVDTRKDGRESKFQIKRTWGSTPFEISLLSETATDRNPGTVIYAYAIRNILFSSVVAEVVGTRFVADPEFRIYVDQSLVDMMHPGTKFVASQVAVHGLGDLPIRRYDAGMFGKTSKLNGVAWWVNRRLVGEPGWEVFDGPLLDARKNEAHRYTYIVEVDALKSDVRQDWSGFYSNARVNAVKRAVSNYVRDDLRGLTAGSRRENKLRALRVNREAIKALPLISQEQVAQFAEELQVRSPTMNARDLENAVEVLANLEGSWSGYTLLERLAKMSSAELDELEAVLSEWSILDVKQVLRELQYRLKLIAKLDELVEKKATDELHELQPLFAKGLWIFGPEFESVDFTSNRTLATVVRQLLGGGEPDSPRDRPDFVILPDSTIGLYSCDSFNDDHEVDGLGAICIVELKRGGSTISDQEKDQALRYARELRRTGKAKPTTKITAYVLGTNVDNSANEEIRQGLITIHPVSYHTILRRANARTFHLYNKLEASSSVYYSDKELDEIMNRYNMELDLNAIDSPDEWLD